MFCFEKASQISEFFAEERDTLKRVEARNLTKSEMDSIRRVMLTFPKSKLVDEDTRPILSAGRKIIFTSGMTGLAGLIAARAIPNLPK